MKGASPYSFGIPHNVLVVPADPKDTTITTTQGKHKHKPKFYKQKYSSSGRELYDLGQENEENVDPDWEQNDW